MKKQKTIEVDICDFCGTDEQIYNCCLGCGKHACYECVSKKKVGVKYSHSVWASGSGDGFFCNQCATTPSTKIANLLRAFLRIAALRTESKAFGEDFTKRGEEAGAYLKSLQGKES